MTKFHPGLRHNRHMVRLIKTDDARKPFELGTPYGNCFTEPNATERRRRILDQWCIPNQSPRLPESPSTAEALPPRAQRSHFHQLHDETQDLLVRRHAAEPMNRRDVLPGTRSRMQLGRNHCALRVESWPLLRSPQALLMGKSPDTRVFGRSDAFADNFAQRQLAFGSTLAVSSRKR